MSTLARLSFMSSRITQATGENGGRVVVLSGSLEGDASVLAAAWSVPRLDASVGHGPFLGPGRCAFALTGRLVRPRAGARIPIPYLCA